MRDLNRPIPVPPYLDTASPGPYQQQPGQPPVSPSEEEKRIQREIEELKRKIGRFFTVYEIRVGFDAIAFHCRMDEVTLEEKFELVRNILKPEYIPLLQYEGGEHIIYVMKKPKVKYKGTNVNLILLIITIITTTIAGSFLWVPYDAARAGKSISEIDALGSLFSPENLVFGALFFSLPLLAILGAHETSHYIAAKKHGVAASLPFFIPMAPPLGTLGAVISMREPIPNKKALIDIGAAGPIAGLIMAIPVCIIGIILTNEFGVVANLTEPGGSVLYNPLILIGLNSLVPMEGNLLAHPTFFAGWVGILVTALNLLPVGQLDGGHIVRALVGDKTRYIGMGTVFIMLLLGFYFNYFGFVFLIIIIILLGGGLRHPPPLNDVTKLDRRRVMVGVLALIIFVVSFHPAPIQFAGLEEYGFEMSSELNETAVSAGGFVEFNVTFTNTGSVENQVFMDAAMNETKIDEGWNLSLIWEGEDKVIYNITDEESLSFLVGEDVEENVTVRVRSPPTASIGDNATVTIGLRWNSWELNEYSDIVKIVRSTSEEIKVTVG